MKAYILKSTGKPKVLKIPEIPDPIPREGEVVVKMEYIGINFAEILSRKGLYGWAPKRPYVLGMEGSGIIEKVGDGVDRVRVGQKVMVANQYGCYAEKVVIPEERAIPIITGFSKTDNSKFIVNYVSAWMGLFEGTKDKKEKKVVAPEEHPTTEIEGFSMQEGASFLVNYMTAWVALFELAKLQKGEKVLITAAAGGVGTAAVQLAAKLGCKVYGIAGSEEKINFIKSLGAEAAFNYREKDCFEKLHQTVGGVDVVVEMVGGKIYKESFKLMNSLGRITVIGFASLDIKWWNPVSWWRTLRDIPRMKIMDLADKSGGVMASHLGYLLDNPELMQAVFSRLNNFVIDNKIKPVIGKIFPFDQADNAHDFIESRKSIGKVLLKI